uniref:tetratricopeptide repeat protein n=1 Tax=Nostoc sp. CCY0012 TaxID=1056123 RepID=UPI0039C67228
ETYLLMERYTEALPDFDRVIELDPNYQWAIARRGETYLMLKQYNIALANFNRAIELDSDSNSDWYLYNRTLVYLALNLLENARTDIEIAIQLANNKYEENSQNWCNTFNLALYCLTAQYTSNAEDLYRYALSQGASSESVRAAIQDLKDFLTIFPDNVQAQSMRQLLQSALTTT